MRSPAHGHQTAVVVYGRDGGGKLQTGLVIVKEAPGEAPRLYPVRETKETVRFEDLDGRERDKINCGTKHFSALRLPAVGYAWTDAAGKV